MEAVARNLPRRLGRYEIVGRLALGGMAEILLARITGPSGFERPVVVKRILPHLAELPEFVSMFLDEGRLAARIRHPNVVQVQELCRENEELYLVMEYLEGEAAAGLARRARARRKRLSPALAAHVVAEACSGLHAAHELTEPDGAPLEIVHRDVSPHNVFIGYDGTVKVLDFGIAKARDRITRTEAGMLKGKFEYMSPEQANGEPLDRRSDVFALGIVLYELSTGRRLFKRATHTGTLRAVMDEPIVAPSRLAADYPPALETICLRALDRDPRKRPPTAQDLRRELLSALRAFDGPELPEAALSSLMQELFSDRIAEKEEMMARMREGRTPANVPRADVDESEELPTIEVDVASEVRARPFESEPPASRGRRGLVVALLAAGLVAAGVAVWIASLTIGVDGQNDGSTPPLEGRVEPERPFGPMDEQVSITIDSEPPGASVELEGEARGETPLTLELSRGDEPVELRLALDGHEPRIERLTPDVSQRLRLALTAITEGSPPRARPPRRHGTMAAETPPEPAETATPEPPPTMAAERDFRRFN